MSVYLPMKAVKVFVGEECKTMYVLDETKATIVFNKGRRKNGPHIEQDQVYVGLQMPSTLRHLATIRDYDALEDVLTTLGEPCSARQIVEHVSRIDTDICTPLIVPISKNIFDSELFYDYVFTYGRHAAPENSVTMMS
jgi:hypothetical protein